MNISTLLQYLSAFMHVDLFDDCIVNGLQVEGHRPIRRIATGVSATAATIQQACACDADLLLTHHGLLMKDGCSSICGNLHKKVSMIMQHGLHLVSYHLPLDAHREVGNNWPVAQALGWQECLPFGQCSGQYIGVRGKVPTTTGTQLFQQLQNYFGVTGLHCACDRMITSCAFLSGSGKSAFDEAIALGVDCFISGSIDNVTWDNAQEHQIHCMAFGHVATEKTGVRLLGEHVAQRFSLEHVMIDDSNPL